MSRRTISPGSRLTIVKGFLSAGLAIIAMISFGCGKKPTYIAAASMPSQPQRAVRLAPGDVIDVKFFSVPELNETQAIRPDGRIALQLVGEVDVQGRTPSEVSAELSQLYTPHLKTPDVTVIIRGYEGRRIFVAGEVRTPGMIPMPGSMTALEAIMHAGGFALTRARVENVVVIRHLDGKRYGAKLDMKPALKGLEFEEFYLEPSDIVFVPRTRITKVAQWIDQHINQLIPMIGVEYSTMLNDDDTVTIDLTRSRRVDR